MIYFNLHQVTKLQFSDSQNVIFISNKRGLFCYHLPPERYDYLSTTIHGIKGDVWFPHFGRYIFVDKAIWISCDIVSWRNSMKSEFTLSSLLHNSRYFKLLCCRIKILFGRIIFFCRTSFITITLCFQRQFHVRINFGLWFHFTFPVYAAYAQHDPENEGHGICPFSRIQQGSNSLILWGILKINFPLVFFKSCEFIIGNTNFLKILFDFCLFNICRWATTARWICFRF